MSEPVFDCRMCGALVVPLKGKVPYHTTEGTGGSRGYSYGASYTPPEICKGSGGAPRRKS